MGKWNKKKHGAAEYDELSKFTFQRRELAEKEGTRNRGGGGGEPATPRKAGQLHPKLFYLSFVHSKDCKNVRLKIPTGSEPRKQGGEIFGKPFPLTQ